MRHALWPAASIALLSAAVPAAQGVHPGPLPAPIAAESDRAQAAPGAGQTGLEAYGGSSGYATSPPGQDYGHGDRGYPPPAPPGGGRGYWQWVPSEPAGSGPYGPQPSAAPYAGYGDSYPPNAYGAPPQDGYGDPYRGRIGPPSYGGYGDAYPSYGPADRRSPDAYAAPPGYFAPPPGAGREAGPDFAPAAPGGASGRP